MSNLMVETDGIWHLFAATPHEYGMPVVDRNTVTELDMVDPEYIAARAYVRCEECDDTDEAIDMCLQPDGEWLCPTHDLQRRQELHERF